jgi:autotransporter-associated beta strand protein/T5SS/PEP-CTERM-associated repeat protein
MEAYSRVGLLASAFIVLSAGIASAQQTLYWDTNGSTAGSSAGATAPGSWSGQNWSTSPAGTAGTGLWSPYIFNNDIAVFSAGTNATGAYAVTIPSVLAMSQLHFNLGNVTLQSANPGAVGISTGLAPFILSVKSGARGTFTANALRGQVYLRKIDPGVMELSGATALISGYRDYYINPNAPTDFPGSFEVDGGSVVLSNGGQILASSNQSTSVAGAELRVGVTAAGAVDVTHGLIQLNTARLGVNAGSSGTVNLQGPGLFTVMTLTGATRGGPSLVLGDRGTGAINLTKGSLNLNMAAAIVFGANAGGFGSLTIGEGTRVNVDSTWDISKVFTKGAGSGVINLAGGKLNVRSLSGGGRVDIPVPMTMAGQSTLELSTHTQCRTSSSGTGGITKLGGATLFLSGNHIYTGDTVISYGGLTVEDGGVLHGTSKIVNNSALTVTDAAVEPAGALQIGTGGGIGTTEVRDYGYLAAGSFIEVGSSGIGTLNISNGGWVASDTTTALGVVPGSFTGTVNVTGEDSGLEVGTTLFVGHHSAGFCTVGSGGSITAGNVALGQYAGSSGSFFLNQGGTLAVGGTDGISRGTGEMGFFLSGGTLRVNGTSLTTTVPMTLTHNSLIDTRNLNCVLSGALSGTGALRKAGAGILYLNAANSYTGGTTNNVGQIVVPAASGLGTGPVTINGGNIHSTGNFSRDSAVAVTGEGSSLTTAGYMEFGLGGAGSVVVTDGGQVSTPSSIALGVLGGGTSGFADVSGAGSAMSCGTTLYVGYLSSGTVNVGTGGSVTVGEQMLLAAGPASQALLNLNSGGTLNVGGVNGIAKGEGTAVVNLSGGLIKVTGSSLTTSVPLTLLSQTTSVDTSGVEATFSGPLSGPGHLAKTGAGTLYLTGSNTSRSGDTTVWAGTISAATPASLGTRNLYLNGGTLDLPFSGTATVQTLSFDGAIQLGGTWGSLTSTATNKTSRITGPGILQVLSAVPPVIFNETTNAGLRTTRASGTMDLLTATGVTPAGGTFSGPGITGNTFDPVAAGYGIQTITYTAGTNSGSFTISVTGGLTLDEEGGTMAPLNYALPSQGGTAFAKDVVLGYDAHSIAHLNDGNYGNDFSWIGNSAGSFVGIRLSPGTPAINRIAFSRDNTGVFTDRSSDFYIVQYTTAPAPDASTTAWTTIGAVDYRNAPPGITQPSRRHVFSFPAVQATGIRILTTDFATAIDEIEVYPAIGLFLTNGITLVKQGGSIAYGNLSSTGTAFAKDEIGSAPHAIPNVNNGSFGNASSWIGGTANSFVGINLGASKTLDRIAFGRDNTAEFGDRCLGRYTLQYTTVPAPDNTTPDASWTNIGLLDYLSSIPGFGFDAPSRRHEFTFPAVTATGIRLIVPSGAAIDELELYLSAPHLKLEQPVGTLVGASVDFGYLFPDAPTTKTFTITNDGTSTLTLGGLDLQGVTSGDFTSTPPATNTLAPGASTTFTITFNVGAAGQHNASVTLPSNDAASPTSFNVTGTSARPSVNTAATNGLIIDLSGGPVNLATLSEASPPGGNFSGPGMSGDTFNPTTAGFGIHTLTYSYGGASVSFTISVVGGITLVSEGGTFAPYNLATNGTAFAKDVIPGFDAHTIPHLNDGIYGNANSWIGDSANTFAGINLGATPIAIDRIAFGRDNQGNFPDRSLDHYIVQYTTTPNPNASTTEWTNIGAVDYRSVSISNPWLRHLFSFPTVNATGLRIITATAGTAIDEIELYSPNTPQELWRLSYFNSTANSGDAADDADPNHNGIPNLIEYALGGHPVNGSTGQSILPTGSRSGNQMRIHLTRRLDRSDVDLTVQASTNLTTWTNLARSSAGQPFALIESGTGINESGSGNTRAVTITDPLTDTRRFLRLSVTPTPSP